MTAPEVGAAELAAGLAEGRMVAIDVRTPEEWDAAHIAGATWIPMFELGRRMDELPRDVRLAMVCRSGSRSGAVADHLAGAGYDVVNLAGGMQAWVAAGLPVEPPGGPVL